MTVAFECVEMTVADFDSAVAQYELLFDCVLPQPTLPEGKRKALLPLGNTTIVLAERETHTNCVSGLVLSLARHSGDEQAVANALGLDVRVCGAGQSVVNSQSVHTASADLVEEGTIVDHVVLRTNNAAGCIDLFERDLGVRLALDKTVEKWGGRMLFFRAGKMTLEVIASDEVEISGFWGVAYRCKDIDAFCARLKGSGVAVSEIRDGRKPGTRVATLKSHCLDVPTLLIQQLERE